ncbi:DUF4129 domain-containing protein [Mariniflexile sp.]|uniref:DUF4129 domain-containing protein n=1 Tax=Mariniflexile sp. TaxID=1979402 RepID=UPI0035654537
MTKNKLPIKLYTVGLFLSNNYCFAQDTIQRDSSNLKVTYFKEAIEERYKGDDFNYNINDTGGINLLQRLIKKFFDWINDVFGVDIDFINYKTLEYIVYAFLGVACLYLIVKFLMESPINSVFKTETKDIDTFKYVEENIKDVNFDTLISSAIKENNYRLATRYLYLKSLKLLTNKNIIDWHYDKTNSDYINEIKDEDTKSVFKRISYIYDYVWYGEFPIDEATYNKNQSDFNKLNRLPNG